MKMLRREFLLGASSALLLASECAKVLAAVDERGGEPGSIPIGGAAVGTVLFRPQLTNETTLLKLCEPFSALSTEEIKSFVPPQGGFSYAGCPHCDGGTGHNNLAWKPELDDKIQCRFCNEIFPSEKYLENHQLEIKTPTGGVQIFKYHQDAAGTKYWFEARRWFDQRTFLEKGAYSLAQLYNLDPAKYPEVGAKAAAILEGFAAAYPNYIVKYEYPAQEKVFITMGSTAKDFVVLGVGAGYAAKWSSWGYTDLSVPLLLAYDQLAEAEFVSTESRHAIETTLLGGMVSFVANHGALPVNNMSPTLWRSQAIAANVLRRPEIAASIIPGMRGLLLEGFTYDGFWKEGTASYHRQTAGGFQNVFDALYPATSVLSGEAYWAHIPPDFRRAIRSVDIFRLPNQHYAAINDTWPSESYRGAAIEESRPHLMPGLGYSILGLGAKENQMQTHLKWSGRFGHNHYDSLNLLLFAKGKELVSDIGYTHTKARPWASCTAAHSTVLVDEKNQAHGEPPKNALGNLSLFSVSDPNFQATEASAESAYPNLVSDYRRALVNVQVSDDVRYVVDIFQVAGGSQHDWILHGSADEDQQIELNAADGQSLPLQNIPSLLPADFKFKPAQSEGEWELMSNGPWALGNFRDTAKTANDAAITATFRATDNSPAGLQSWIMGAPQTTYITARSWNVRGAVEDQAKFDEFLRSSFIVRRSGTGNRFVAVHVPFTGDSPVRRVTQLPWGKNGLALKIETAGVVDFIVYQPDAIEHTGELDGQEVRFSGRVALVRVADGKPTLKMIGGGKLQFGKHMIGNTSLAAPLLKVQDDTFTVQGSFVIAPGEVIIIRHGDESTSAFHVAKVSRQGENTITETQDPPTLEGDVAGSLKMLFFPHAELPGPHLVTSDETSSV